MTEPTVMPTIDDYYTGASALTGVDIGFGSVRVSLTAQEARVLNAKLTHALTYYSPAKEEA